MSEHHYRICFIISKNTEHFVKMSEHHYWICFIISKNSEHFVKMSEQPYWMFLLMHCKEMQKIEEELEYPNFVLIAQLQFLIFFRRIAKTLSWMQNTSTGYSCQNQNVELYKLWQDNKNALLRLQLLQILVNSDLASLKRVNTAVHVNVFVTIAEHKYWISLSRLQNNCIMLAFFVTIAVCRTIVLAFFVTIAVCRTIVLAFFVTIAVCRTIVFSFFVIITDCRTPVSWITLSRLQNTSTSYLLLSRLQNAEHQYYCSSLCHDCRTPVQAIFCCQDCRMQNTSTTAALFVTISEHQLAHFVVILDTGSFCHDCHSRTQLLALFVIITDCRTPVLAHFVTIADCRTPVLAHFVTIADCGTQVLALFVIHIHVDCRLPVL